MLIDIWQIPEKRPGAEFRNIWYKLRNDLAKRVHSSIWECDVLAQRKKDT